MSRMFKIDELCFLMGIADGGSNVMSLVSFQNSISFMYMYCLNMSGKLRVFLASIEMQNDSYLGTCRRSERG